jgi:aspartate-semialdehyde dehydrogenase
MREPIDVAVVGATGLVGEALLELLAERDFPLGELKLLASPRSAGRKLACGQREARVEALSPEALAGSRLVFISATDAISRAYGKLAAASGGVTIDDSGVWRMDPEVPLVVPEVNPEDVESHRGLLAIPNCSTTPVAMVLAPLHRAAGVRRVTAATYQSVSGTGRAALEELEAGSRASLAGREPEARVYPHPIAFNLLPEIGSFQPDGYTSEEWKMVRETRKILHAPELAVSATCVRVPVRVGHSVALHLELDRPMEAEEARALLAAMPGLELVDEPGAHRYPQPIAAAGRDPVYVGRIRRDLSHPTGLALWVVLDNLRKGAALDALQIAEELLRRGRLQTL